MNKFILGMKKEYMKPTIDTVQLETDASVMLLGSGTGLEPLYQ